MPTLDRTDRQHHSSRPAPCRGILRPRGQRTSGEPATLSRVPLRSCAVTITDARGVRHTVDVVAESLLEAAVLGVQVLRRDGWIDGVVGGATKIDVEVRELVTRHTVTMQQIERWLTGATISPNERVKKDRVRALLVRARSAALIPTPTHFAIYDPS